MCKFEDFIGLVKFNTNQEQAKKIAKDLDVPLVIFSEFSKEQFLNGQQHWLKVVTIQGEIAQIPAFSGRMRKEYGKTLNTDLRLCGYPMDDKATWQVYMVQITLNILQNTGIDPATLNSQDRRVIFKAIRQSPEPKNSDIPAFNVDTSAFAESPKREIKPYFSSLRVIVDPPSPRASGNAERPASPVPLGFISAPALTRTKTLGRLPNIESENNELPPPAPVAPPLPMNWEPIAVEVKLPPPAPIAPPSDFKFDPWLAADPLPPQFSAVSQSMSLAPDISEPLPVLEKAKKVKKPVAKKPSKKIKPLSKVAQPDFKETPTEEKVSALGLFKSICNSGRLIPMRLIIPPMKNDLKNRIDKKEIVDQECEALAELMEALKLTDLELKQSDYPELTEEEFKAHKAELENEDRAAKTLTSPRF